ncbi:MAG: metalloregulator ArsR/SmtB family transcription factor [Clostridiales bacterium]|jgi:ArsR family transcriptional regulator|nr:metalloregulator ArsR/SmtB family transcription factor [Clostridiales bacterium]
MNKDIAAEKREINCDCDVIHADIVEHVKKEMPDDKEFNRLSVFFKVFGDSTRIKIIWALDEHELCVCDLAVLLNTTKSAVSHQLAYLKQHNLVSFRREGRVVLYSLADDHIKLIFNSGKAHIEE